MRPRLIAGLRLGATYLGVVAVVAFVVAEVVHPAAVTRNLLAAGQWALFCVPLVALLVVNRVRTTPPPQ